MRIKLPCGVVVRTVGSVRGQHGVRLEYDGQKSELYVCDTSGAFKAFENSHSVMRQFTARGNLLPFARFLRQLHKEMGIKPKKSR